MQSEYYSQHNQDEVLDKFIFPGSKKGIFFDIGANDGITYSNTFFFEKSRNWTGICVEPLPDTFEKLKENRNCILENCAVGAKNSKDIFLAITGYSEMLSGLKQNYNKKHLERIDAEIASYGGSKKEIEITTVNINTMLASHNLTHVDYCNIDTEGSEMAILNALDFSKITINVITVEANYRIDRFKIWFLLFRKGYKFICNVGNDMLFIHDRLIPGIGRPASLRNKINKHLNHK